MLQQLRGPGFMGIGISIKGVRIIHKTMFSVASSSSVTAIVRGGFSALA